MDDPERTIPSVGMSSIALTPVSYLVLGLVARSGPATPYELKRFASHSIGYFWSFPHSQLYAEPERLARAGLLEENREIGGRRRRRYAITAAGRIVLREWLREPTTALPQLRDLGLLKLFFGEFVEPDDIAALARAQESAHRERLTAYRKLEAHLAERPTAAHGIATLRMGLAFERMAVRFWAEVAARPPSAPKPRAGAARRARRVGA